MRSPGWTFVAVLWLLSMAISASPSACWGETYQDARGLAVKQITFGPKHHFFGYIGHVQNIPWNASGRYIVALRTDFQDRMPRGDETADIVLLDTADNYRVRVVDQTRAWNPQQGTMLYWNPETPETQFVFNDRDPTTGKLFTVLFDLSRGEHGERVKEYRFDDNPIANSGVAQLGGWFAAINYGRLARLRPVTGYPQAFDWTRGDLHPANDGLFRVDMRTGEKQLLVSFAKIAAELSDEIPNINSRELFINHTLSNRSSNRIFFFIRADFDDRERRTNIPFLVDANGENLVRVRHFIGGHPEWGEGDNMIGAVDGRQIVFDTRQQKIVGTIASPDVIPSPEGDIALSPNGRWLVNGARQGNSNSYVFVHLQEQVVRRSQPLDITGWTSGDLRCDPAPCWNRASDRIVVPAIANDDLKTRQMFLIEMTPP